MPLLICFVSQDRGVAAFITVKQPWFHPIFLSCFNRLFIKIPQSASNRTALSEPRRPETLFHITTVTSNLCLFPSFHAMALIFLLLSQRWFPKYDIITQRLSEGSVTHGALQMQLEFELFKQKQKKEEHSIENFTQGCWVIDCISVTSINNMSITGLQTNTLKTTPPIQDRILL